METALEQNPLRLFPAFRAAISPALLKYGERTVSSMCHGISGAGNGRGPGRRELAVNYMEEAEVTPRVER